MEAYWQQEFDIVLGDKKKHLVKLYNYSVRSIALVSTPEFGKAFSKEFKKIDAKFNKNLKIDGQPTVGWIFNAQTETQEKLNELLKNIYTGEIRPLFSDIIKPDFESKANHNQVFNLITRLMEMLSEDTEQFIIAEDKGVKTTAYYNSDEDTVTEGDLVYMFEGGKKKLEIYQLQQKE